jgi:hypothetical protein
MDCEMPMAPKSIWREVVWNFTTATGGNNGTHDETRFQSVLMELDFAIAFSTIVTPGQEKTKTNGNLENARDAFSEGVRFLFHADDGLSREARHEVIQKLALLNTKLRDPDEQTPPAPRIHIPSGRASDD